jgi:photosystem II stability/assembly factor-like uncharacterized protein
MNDRDLEDLLRSRPEPLRPPAGRWETVRRRARRRRIAKLSAALLGTAVLVAGGLTPFLLRSNDNGGGTSQRLTIAAPAPQTGAPATAVRTRPSAVSATPSSRASSAVHPSSQPNLGGFHPRSVSFVSQAEGFLLGTGAGRVATIARTSDGGASWTRLPDVKVPVAGTGIRFATPAIGFLFGARYLVTTNGGRSWASQPSPGFISDLETMNGRVYALVTACPTCRRVALYSASTTAPDLKRVPGVPSLIGDAVSVSVAQDSAYFLDTVKGGPGQVWATLDGDTWSHRASPCGTTMGLITQWSPAGVAAACDVRLFGVGKESKQVFVSTNGARTWTPLAAPPTRVGYINSVSASGPETVVVGDDQSGMDVTTDGGRHWTLQGPQMTDGASFVGFISSSRVVALPQDPKDDFFTTSYTAGQTWVTTSFAK